MRLSPGFSLLVAFAAIACGGGGRADLFTDGGTSSTAHGGSTAGSTASGQGGATAVSSGGSDTGGGPADGGASTSLGGAPASGGDSAAGTTSSNGGALSSSGGRETSAGADALGGMASASGGAGTAGAGSGGAPNSTGGKASASGGTASGGRASGGAGSVLDCAMLRSKLSSLLTDAQVCQRTTMVDQCTGFVSTECGCEVPVNNPDSAETKAYNAALAELKRQCPTVACTAALCAKPQGATCTNSGTSGPHCVANSFGTGTGFGP